MSGRQFSDLKRFLVPLRLPCAAEYGAQRHLVSGEVIGPSAPDLGMDLKAAMQQTRKSMDPVYGQVFIYELCCLST